MLFQSKLQKAPKKFEDLKEESEEMKEHDGELVEEIEYLKNYLGITADSEMEEIVEDKTGAGANKRRIKALKKQSESASQETNQIQAQISQTLDRLQEQEERRNKIIGSYQVMTLTPLFYQITNHIKE